MTEQSTGIKSITSGKTLTVFLDGDIDHHNARMIRSKIDTKIYIQRPDELILDLSRVCFMDSSGLGLILGRYTKAVELGIVFKVVNPTPQIRKILDLAGTERLIKIEQYQ
ncbi:MAG: STAS domain-containing protein [Ruminococcaceae bacterium]|nr:STAS domain-containing protein [Oscillospiraceae bacterium]